MQKNKELSQLIPMRYYSFPANFTPQKKREKLDVLIRSNQYIYSLKTDGNWGRMIWEDEGVKLQSRSISKVTGTYGEFSEKVLFYENMKDAFYDTTVLLGEIYMEGGRDRDVSTILRCKPDKAISRQNEGKVLRYRIFDCWYYNGESLLDAPIIERIKYLPLAVKAINNELVSYVKYYQAKEDTFYNELNNIFAKGGEGVVLYHKMMRPCESLTPAWQTLKVKQEINNDVDCFIYGTESSTVLYSGKDIENWSYWMDTRTNEKFYNKMYAQYVDGNNNLIPITKGCYYEWPGAIKCAVYDENHKPVVLCKCSGLTEEFKEELKNNYDNWHMCPIKITGMMFSETSNGKGETEYSIRHPRLVSIRDTDISIEDCTLAKIIG